MDKKYSWNFRLNWVVEFVRKDAEISIDADGDRYQKVIVKGCHSREEAEKRAVEYCEKLAQKLKDGIRTYTSTLKDAQE